MADLRTWLDEVDKFGQLMRVDNVDWDLELSTLTEIINERSKIRPAIVFDKIKGYPAGFRIAVNALSSVNRLALTMGMKPDLSEFDFVEQWRQQVKKIQPIEPRKVTVNPLIPRDLLDQVDRGRMTFITDSRSVLTMKPLNLRESVINGRRQMRAGALGLPGAYRPIIQHDHRLSFGRQQIRRHQSRDPRPHHADIRVRLLGRRLISRLRNQLLPSRFSFPIR
jgi:hypothetical protein